MKFHIEARRKRTRLWVQIQIPNPMATLYCPERVHVAQTRTRTPSDYFCKGEESESESVPESNSGGLEHHCKNSWSLSRVVLLQANV